MKMSPQLLRSHALIDNLISVFSVIQVLKAWSFQVVGVMSQVVKEVFTKGAASVKTMEIW